MRYARSWRFDEASAFTRAFDIRLILELGKHILFESSTSRTWPNYASLTSLQHAQSRIAAAIMDSYDRESGQVFKETVMRIHSADTIPWEFRCLATNRHPPGGFCAISTSRDGSAKSLQHLCMEKVVSQSKYLKPETLENLPHAIAIRIWTAIRRQWRESFHLWKAFVEAGFKERTFNHCLEVKSWYSLLPLTDTFAKLSSRTCAWVVSLTLANFTVSAAHIKEISRITNLQNLHVQYSRGDDSLNFDDRILEAWSNRAANEGAFSYLESISVVNAPAITSDVFQHLLSFPVLAVFIRAGGGQFRKKDLKTAKQHGWTTFEAESSTHTAFSYHSQSTISSRFDAFAAARGPKNVKELVQSWLPQNTASESVVPRLDAQLGSLDKKDKFDQPRNMSCFQRNPNFAAREMEKQKVDDHAGSRKRRRLNEAKSADFASMLDGG